MESCGSPCLAPSMTARQASSIGTFMLQVEAAGNGNLAINDRDGNVIYTM